MDKPISTGFSRPKAAKHRMSLPKPASAQWCPDRVYNLEMRARTPRSHWIHTLQFQPNTLPQQGHTSAKLPSEKHGLKFEGMLEGCLDILEVEVVNDRTGKPLVSNMPVQNCHLNMHPWERLQRNCEMLNSASMIQYVQ